MGAVVVVGSITIDVTAFAERLPRPGETVLGRDLTLVLGGKGANQAAAAARFGATTSMAGCVGDDVFANLALAGLRAHGVGTDLVRAVAGPTGVAHIRVDAAGQNDIVITPLANAQVGRADVAAALEGRGAGDVLLLQLETPAGVTAHAVHAGRERGLTVVLDPAPAAALSDDVWADVDVVTPNESEAAAITGVAVNDLDAAERAARWFLDRGVGTAVVTLGGDGCVVVSGEGVATQPAFTVTPVDTTAAGDAFTGTLGASLASGTALPDAVRYAMAAGALAVTRRGASASLPSRDDVLALLAAQPRS